MEVMEEEELAEIRKNQAVFEEIRNADLAEVERLEELNKRRRFAKWLLFNYTLCPITSVTYTNISFLGSVHFASLTGRSRSEEGAKLSISQWYAVKPLKR